MPTFNQYRIEFTVGRLPFTWVRPGPNREKVRQLAEQAIREQYGPRAALRVVERVQG